MLRRVIFAMGLGGLCTLVAACDGPFTKGGHTSTVNPTASEAPSAGVAPETNIDIGEPLYTRTEWAPASDQERIAAEPVVIPLANLSLTQRQEVSAQTDGFIKFVGRELQSGEADPINPDDLYVHERTKKKFVRLKEGDPVNKNSVLVLLDDRQASAEYEALVAAHIAALKDVDAGGEMVKFARNLLTIQEELIRTKATPKTELYNAQATEIKYIAELDSKKALVTKAKADMDKANVRLQMHEVRSEINGRVDRILRHRGFSVKATEPIMHLLNLDELRVEGYVPLENVGRLKVGMPALIEPTIVEAPTVSNIDHRQAITSMAYTIRQGEPMILTASEDRTVNVWNSKKLLGTWTLPVPVRSVACTPPTVDNALALTGSDDGKGRLWNLVELAATPVRELKGTHRGPIQCTAFSPDGSTCITADDRDIFLWDVNTGEKLYTFPNGHRGPITDARFIPQGRLVSAGRDNALIVWELGKKAARIERIIDHRAGEVGQLGVSSDGNRVLFDQGKSQMHIVNLADGQTDDVITNVLEQAKFTTTALFSPDDRLVLTASSAEGILQLWRTPTKPGERIPELRRLICPGYSPVSCAMFVPFRDTSLVVVGTQTGHLHIWPAPTKAESDQRFVGEVTFIDGAVDTGGRQLRVWAKLNNTGPFRLRPGTTATMVMIPPLTRDSK
ncbi:hypothetical protein [Tuwongella immobilis]|uniref:Uncharacterized protein n=1 Tax=Tuwongella immobilis TaxID=692036 RepID=A0A6C2YY99_9BACT|nr:hypothetical protein [Tuwongella immobilis]VIP05752.1 wd40 subgroup : Related to WD40-repeat protein (Notchless protein) OS=Piriformospora indica (strain DSM 11827) GN=PIIN_09853 PE=4 SV=1: WD40: WD40: WD40 [Tuwongella immobilis]VTS08860.1 wd40 subgroup : Related to WD40-repeat protein (Notchless protein) OS=Piriformospora indica (strain DSM 11827) GN=PIIN_09853 PE=4 SV=1: WD40: WD40: WD40 [Tuwongella immobilis]